jgi:hypothetical protein
VLRFSAKVLQRAIEGVTSDAVFVDFVDLKAMLRDVVERLDDDD